MFGSKKIKTASSLISSFAQQFKTIVEVQDQIREKEKLKIIEATERQVAAEKEMKMASNAIEKIESLLL